MTSRAGHERARRTVPHAEKEKLFDLARQEGAQAEAMLRSWSGADQADSEVHACARRAYVDVALGEDPEAVLSREDARWRAYAKAQARKVEQAPKMKRGPMAGHSVIHHRWVSPDAFSHHAIHVRAMMVSCKEKAGA